MLGEASKKTYCVQQRIPDLAKDIKEQVIFEIRSALLGLFSIQLDESTDVSSRSQLLTFVRYIKEGEMNEEFVLLVLGNSHKSN